MADSLAVLRSSPKILNLALLVMSYGVSHRLFEFAWKGQLGVLYPSAQQYQVRRSTLPHASSAPAARAASHQGGRHKLRSTAASPPASVPLAAASTPRVSRLLAIVCLVGKSSAS